MEGTDGIQIGILRGGDLFRRLSAAKAVMFSGRYRTNGGNFCFYNNKDKLMRNLGKKLCLISLAGVMLGLTACRSSRSDKEKSIDVATVKSLDVARYMGRWYEIARYDHRFERGMTHVMADYTLLPDGKIRVVNTGVKNGRRKQITGKAKQPDPLRYPGRLEVSFFLWFYSDYYILELGENYRYSVVGSSSADYLWILSRTPQMEKSLLDGILLRLEQRGYDLSRLIFVEQ